MIFRNHSLSAAKFLTVALIAGSALSGCARIRDAQGYVVDEELVSAISPGVDNRESVERTLGRPTFVSEWDDSTWYYVSRNVEQLAFLPSEPTSQQVLTVRFDAGGNVAAVDRQKGLEQVVQLDPASETTPVFGRDSSLFQDIFGNIGRVSSVPGGAGGAPQQ
ncbi:outer membrane protein assembly factor BamE [Pacificimonas flava]|uniref:Outer membrane lipoprotein OmlA n=1 Tax=Pacificimonas flava TaxID=1234595 RepID=M2U2K1_9SPHN|nr:outer membrane protein assembly factor BamE [Pacificimonas flava]EMD82058.1 Outer membrane lipoprotein OmlA [Pacificimonas flava]MBB5280898.1 outer membrane protein assembly factor BamE (lipoprotein component of BamABCDE complex) [Pacificimonas flava]